jgi:hypothetical protein
MKQINDFSFKISHLRNSEHFQFHWSVNRFLMPRMPEIPNLSQPWNSYLLKFEKADRLYKVSQKSEETKELTMRDQMRDEDFKFFGRSVAYESRSLDADTKAAAERLEEVLRNYKGANQKALGENTALVTNFLQDLEKPENRAAVETLSLVALVESLKANNTAVALLYDKRSESLNSRHEEGRLAVVRIEVDKAYLTLVRGLNAFYVANEYGEKNAGLRERLEEIIDGVNARIEQTRLVYARRTGRKLKNNGGDTPDTPETVVPHLMMKDQRVYGESELVDGMASRMSAEAVDTAAFAAALYPAAQGGEVRMYDGYQWESFPVEEFITHTGGSPVSGLVLSPPSNSAFIPELSGNDAPAEVLKDGVVLATLGGLICPSTMGEG